MFAEDFARTVPGSLASGAAVARQRFPVHHQSIGQRHHRPDPAHRRQNCRNPGILVTPVFAGRNGGVDRPQRRLVSHRRTRQHLQSLGLGEGEYHGRRRQSSFSSSSKWRTVSHVVEQQHLASSRRQKRLQNELIQLLSEIDYAGESNDDVPTTATTVAATSTTTTAAKEARVVDDVFEVCIIFSDLVDDDDEAAD